MAKISFRTITVISFVVFVVSVAFLSHVYACLTLAFVLAYLLDPLVAKLGHWGVRRNVAVLVVLMIFFVSVVLAGIIVIPKLWAQGRELMARLPDVYFRVMAVLTPVSEKYFGYSVFQDVDKVVAGLRSEPSALLGPLGNSLNEILGPVFATTFKAVTAVLGLFVIPLMTFYLLRDFPALYERFLYVVPRRHHKMVADVRGRLHGVLGGFIRGQLVVSTVLSAYYAVAFAVLRLDLSLVLGLMAGFLNIIPYLGIISVFALTVVIAVAHGAGVARLAVITIVFAFGMSLEGSLLTPRIVGRRVGLRPLTLLVALLAGGELLGLVGMLLAVPITAIMKVFLEVWLERYRDSEAFKRAR